MIDRIFDTEGSAIDGVSSGPSHIFGLAPLHVIDSAVFAKDELTLVA